MSGRLTPWFPASTKPKRVGVYKRRLANGKARYSFWNGHGWGLYCTTPKYAFSWRTVASSYQALPWCGLATPTKTTAPAGVTEEV